MIDKDVERRFLTRVNKTDCCWFWTGGCRGGCRGRYGAFWYKGRQVSTHRFSYELYVKKIPKNKVIDHLCKNTKCVNPQHLEVVTTQESLLRGNSFQAKNAKKTHCPKNHAYTKENTWVSKKNSRHCKTCARLKSRAYYWKKKNDNNYSTN